MEQIDKRGYLNSDYRFIHLCDRVNEEHTFHYHEFDKLVFMISGQATYVIEGREYFLRPNDILLVSHHDIHMPIIDGSLDYNRVVIWINRDFLTRHSKPDADLSLCFRLTHEKGMCLLRSSEYSPVLSETLSRLEKSVEDTAFGSKIIAEAVLTELLTIINRLAIGATDYCPEDCYRYDRKIAEIIDYINKNLGEDLSNDGLAHRFYVSKSYLMHKFKAETGYTLHKYILQKRLLYSRQLLEEGHPVIEVSQASGFEDYTTFLRAFKQLFGILPSEIVTSFSDDASDAKLYRV